MFSLVNSNEFAQRADAEYFCVNNHRFVITFAAGVAQPVTWDCPRCGQSAQLAGSQAEAPVSDANRSHWDIVRERRTLGELADLLSQHDAQPKP